MDMVLSWLNDDDKGMLLLDAWQSIAGSCPKVTDFKTHWPKTSSQNRTLTPNGTFARHASPQLHSGNWNEDVALPAE
jgi:hypothetical protein